MVDALPVSERRAIILTRHARDTPEGVELTLWAATDDKPARIVIDQQQSVCFIAQQDVVLHPLVATSKPLALKALGTGQPVSALYFQQQQALQAYRQFCQKNSIRLFESDIKPVDRYLMERFIRCGMTIRGDARETASRETVGAQNYDSYRNPLLKPSDQRVSLSCLSLDIETHIDEGSILSIAASWQRDEQRYSHVSIRRSSDWTTAPVGDHSHQVSLYDDERTLLQGFFRWLQQHDPDIIIGWNLISFDLAFMQKRCADLGIQFAMARGGERSRLFSSTMNKSLDIAVIPGRLAMDGITLLRAAFWNFDSFSLEFVAQELLGRGKLIDSKTDKAREIIILYHNNPQQMIDYNRRDCELVEDIFSHAALIDFAIERSQMTGLGLGRMGGSMTAFDHLYLPRLHRRGYVAGDRDDVSADIPSPGGYVMDSQPGLFENVLVFDFKSLYPSIIRSFLIDPLGMVLADDNSVPGFHGAQFNRDRPILPELITHLWAARDRAKMSHNASLSQAIKIIMNSFYGVLGSARCRFHDHRLASSITRRGHEIIQSTQQKIESCGHTVIYGDTDSVFVLLGDEYSYQQAQACGQRLLGMLNRWWRHKLQDELGIESHLELEFETHFTRFLMPTTRSDTTGSKKRYAGMVLKEGEKRLIFKGMESVRSDSTPLARDFQRQLYWRVFNHIDYADYIESTLEKLQRGELDEQLGYRKRLRKPLHHYRKNVPPHVQAARKSKLHGSWVRYFITINGPQPEDNQTSPLDYQHYIQRQLAPAADSLLFCLGTSFEETISRQMRIF